MRPVLPAHFPTLEAVSAALVEETADLPVLPEDDEPHDYRLQVLDDGTWCIRVGDPSYDTDHHGSWGAGCCYCPVTPGSAVWDAEELLEEAAEDYAQQQDARNM
jgi:hypothetical protein